MCDQPLLIALEGLRGVGKSTVAPLLAMACDATLVPTVPEAYQAIRRHVDATQNAEARMCLYLSALFNAVEQIQRLLEKGTSVVVESYFARCLTTHSGVGSRLNVVLPPDLPSPSTYRLKCTEAERQRRIAMRAKPTTHWDALAESHTHAIDRAYDRFPMHPVDTTHRSPEQVVKAILRHERQAPLYAEPKPVGTHPHLLPPVRQGPG